MSFKLSPVNVRLSVVIFLSVLACAQFYWLYTVYDLSAGVAIADAFGGYILLYGLFLFIRYSPTFYLPRYLKYGIIDLQSLVLTLVWIYACKCIFTAIFSEEKNYASVWQETFFIRGLIGWILLCGFILLHFLLTELNKARDAVAREQQAEQLRKEAELFKLRQQLQPHFLFNSLNSINALIGHEPQNARKMVQQLSDYLRNTLKKEDDNFIAFQEELADLRLYLAIEQVRFGHRLVIEEHMEVDCHELKIPPFLLQPLVENAIKYGLYGTTGKVVIRLRAYVEHPYFVFSISNPYDPETVTPKGTGFGLESIRRRLYLLFARNDLLSIDTRQHQEMAYPDFCVVLKIPVTASPS